MNTKKLRLEGQDIVTHDGQLVRPLSDNERILLAEVEARSPENYLWVKRYPPKRADTLGRSRLKNAFYGPKLQANPSSALPLPSPIALVALPQSSSGRRLTSFSSWAC
jgi:hypothetical protein